MLLAFCGRIGGQTTAVAGVITSPAPGSALTGASTTFAWTAGSGGVTGYYLHVGTSLGAGDLVNMGPLSGASATVTLPTSGAAIYVQLETHFDGTILENNNTYTEYTQSGGVITSPSPSSTLTGASTTFTWAAGSGGVTGYYLHIGTSPGASDLANICAGTNASATVTLPTNGATIYVQLETHFGSTVVENNNTYTEVTLSGGLITSPTPGTTLTGALTTFTWTAGSGGVARYYLHIGTSLGAGNLVNMGVGTNTSATVTLPTNGTTIYVQLETHLGGTILENNNTYTEVAQSGGVITSPTPGTTLTGASTTFTWATGTDGVTGYYLHVGTSLGTGDLVNMGVGTNTSAAVTLPTDGAEIYVQLETHFGSTVVENYNTYRAASSSPTLSGLSCTSGSMTGAGTDSCTVTLNASAATGGFVVSLASNNSAVTVPASVTVASGATTGSFTATVSSVSTAVTVTLTASAGSVAETFALQLGTGVPTLSINATSISFGDVFVNSPATQSVTLSSTGTAPVTVSAASVSGTGFSVSGATFPLTLNPTQTATLSVEFNPVATLLGLVSGSLTITSNSSTNPTATIALSGTGESVEVNLTWDAPSSSPDPVAGYNVYRAPSGSTSYQLVSSVSNSQLAYTDTGVQAGLTYDYIVESVDASGVASSPSNMASVDLP